MTHLKYTLYSIVIKAFYQSFLVIWTISRTTNERFSDLWSILVAKRESNTLEVTSCIIYLYIHILYLSDTAELT